MGPRDAQVIFYPWVRLPFLKGLIAHSYHSSKKSLKLGYSPTSSSTRIGPSLSRCPISLDIVVFLSPCHCSHSIRSTDYPKRSFSRDRQKALDCRCILTALKDESITISASANARPYAASLAAFNRWDCSSLHLLEGRSGDLSL